VESKPKELEDEYFFEEFEDSIDTLQPIPKEMKPYQSSFDFKDTALACKMCGNSLVPRASLKWMTLRRSSPCGMSFKSHGTPTSIPIWCGGHCLDV
jgi:hypothetical protein